jgi:hypothetical protein
VVRWSSTIFQAVRSALGRQIQTGARAQFDEVNRRPADVG